MAPSKPKDSPKKVRTRASEGRKKSSGLKKMGEMSSNLPFLPKEASQCPPSAKMPLMEMVVTRRKSVTQTKEQRDMILESGSTKVGKSTKGKKNRYNKKGVGKADGILFDLRKAGASGGIWNLRIQKRKGWGDEGPL